MVVAERESAANIFKITTIDCNNFIREVSSSVFTRQPKRQIDNQGKVVKIDENLFDLRNNNPGRILPQ